MVAGSWSNEILSPVSSSRLWTAIVKDSHSLMPKLVPDIVSSIVTLQGDGGVGTIRQSNFTSVIKDFSCWKDRVDAIDEEEGMCSKYSVIEGGLTGKKVKSASFELKFEAVADGGSLCKLNAEYETIEESLPTEAETKEMMGSMVAMFKAVAGYLVENPDVYA